MMLIFQNSAQSTQPIYEMCYKISTVKSMGYTSEPISYKSLNEDEINPMALAHAETVFTEFWDTSDEAENEYWNSLVPNV